MYPQAGPITKKVYKKARRSFTWILKHSLPTSASISNTARRILNHLQYLEDTNVHRGILFADALVEQRRAEGDERCGTDAIQELAEVEEPAVPR